MNRSEIKKNLKAFKENNTFEYNRILKSVKSCTPKDGVILDVGCGYGRYLNPLSHIYNKTVGIEKNEHIVQEIRKNGLEAYTPEEFEKKDIQFDTIIMSHIIEHFAPNDLLNMMNFYLSRLKDGGYLIIATPVLTKQFYYDFDHIRPYYPQSIIEVFSNNDAQVQYYGKSTLEIQKVWFRRSRIQIWQNAMLFNNKITKNICTGVNLILALLFRVSGSIIGYKSGWIGVFKKV